MTSPGWLPSLSLVDMEELDRKEGGMGHPGGQGEGAGLQVVCELDLFQLPAHPPKAGLAARWR